MRSVRSALGKYAVAASTSMREKLAYPGNYFASMFTYALFVFIFSRVWASAYAGKSEIAGYTMSMAIWYFIVAEVPGFGFGRFFWTLSRDMKSGQVAYLLTRPYDYVGYHFAERFGGSLLEAGLIMIEGLVIGLIFAGAPPGLPSPGVGMEAARVAFVLVSLFLAGVLNFMLQISLAMTAFWLEENEAFFWIFQKLSLVVGTLIPIEFLPDRAARIAAWTPFPYLSYAPARIAVAFTVDGALALVARQALWIVVALVIAKAVFAFGSRRLSVNGG